MKLQEATDFLEKHGEQAARNFLRSLREYAKLNQLEFAKLSRVPQSNIHRIEEGKQGITPKTFARLVTSAERRAERNARARALRTLALAKRVQAAKSPKEKDTVWAEMTGPEKEAVERFVAEKESADRTAKEYNETFQRLGPLGRYAYINRVQAAAAAGIQPPTPQEWEASQKELLARGAKRKVSVEEKFSRTSEFAVKLRTELSAQYWVKGKFVGEGFTRAVAERIDKVVDELLAAEVKRQKGLAQLEKIQSKVHDPHLSKIIESFRHSLRSLEEENEELRQALRKARSDDE